jgi:hypothetical protein
MYEQFKKFVAIDMPVWLCFVKSLEEPGDQSIPEGQ